MKKIVSSNGTESSKKRGQLAIIAMLWTVLFVSGFAGLVPNRVHAQLPQGCDLSGSVQELQGGSISGAKVVLENPGTKVQLTAVSGHDGEFAIKAAPAGKFNLSIASTGHKTYVIQGLVLVAGDNIRITSKLPVGKPSITVIGTERDIVRGGTTAISQVAGTSNLTGKSVSDIPQNERNYINVAQISVGTNAGTMNQAATPNTAQPGAQHNNSAISVNGQPDLVNNHLIDGLDNNDRFNGYSVIHPSVDAIASVQVQTSAYPAEMGRTGAGILNIITKSGTNKYHGSIFEFFRNDLLDAYAFQFGAQNHKPELRQNQVGINLGGPAIKNKLYFFADYEGYFLVQGTNPVKLAVPTLYEEQNPGDFSDIGGTKVASVDSVAKNYFALFPAPNVSTGAYYVGSSPGTNTSHAADVRVDTKLGKKWSTFARYNYNKSTIFVPGVFPTVTVAGLAIQPGGLINTFPSNIYRDGTIGALGADYKINTAWSLHLGTEFADWWQIGNPIDYGKNVNTAFGQPNINIDERTSGLAPIYIASYGTYLGNADHNKPLYQRDNAFEYLAGATWQHKSQNVKLGASLIRRQMVANADTWGAGYWVFATPQSLMAGKYASAQRIYRLTAPHYRMWEESAYAQDNWKVTKSLAFNIGLRWDIFTPFTEIHNQIANFDIHQDAFIDASATGSSTTAGIATQHALFSPRVGFNYAMKHGWSLRGGVGFVYFPANTSNQSTLANQPYLFTLGPITPLTAPSGYSTFAAGLPMPSTPNMANITGTVPNVMDTQWHVSYMEQFNLFAQKDLGWATATVAWVSTEGRHIERQYPDMNAPPPNVASNPNVLRPFYARFPGITSMATIASTGTSSYQSGRITITRPFKNGFGLNYSDTWSHALDNANPGATSANDSLGQLPHSVGQVISGGRRFDYGNGDFDVRNNMAATANYTLPFGKNLKGPRGLLAKGWQVNVVQIWATGLPFTITNATNISGTNPGATNMDRPNVVGTMTIAKPGVAEFFNTSAFQAQEPGTIGVLSRSDGTSPDAGTIGPYWEQRNPLHGPHQRHTDMSLFKTLPIGKVVRTEFRAECFNVTNTANFAAPNSSLGGKAFGELTQMTAGYAPRQIQFALKVEY